MAFIEGSYPEPFSYMNNWFFKDRYNDTIYTVVSSRIKPSYSIDLGKYKIPDDLRFERIGTDQVQTYIQKSPNYCHLNLFEAADKLFIVSESFHKFEKKFIVYDREKKIGILLDNNNVDISKGFENDMDGGMNFWPKGLVNDNQVYMPVDIIAVKK